MKVGDKVKVSVLWGYGYRPVEREGTIKEIYSSGFCKVVIPLEYGGYRIIKGYLKDCTKM